MRIAYLVRGSFYPPFNGERVKTATVASALAANGELTVVDTGRGRFPGPRFPYGQRFDLPYGGSAAFYSSVRYRNPWAKLLAALAGANEPRWLWRPAAARRRAILELMRELRPEVVVIDHPRMAALALEIPARRVAHMHNVESQLAGAAAARSGKWRHARRARQYQHIETELLPRFDQVWAVRAEDADAFRKFGAPRVHLAPNVIPDSALAGDPAVGRPGSVVMFGWLAYGPNADAARYLVQLGARLAAAGRPLAIALVGGDPPADVVQAGREHAWLKVPGFVESLRPYVNQAAVVAVPLAWGAGTKLKVIEALAMGKPLVTTPVGAEGLNLVDGEHALIREPGAPFDEALQRVAADPAAFRVMGMAGREFCCAHYSQTALTAAVSAALAGLGRA